MRLYSRTGAVAIDDAEYGHFEAGPDGGFDLPEELAERERSFCVGGRPLWETDIERQNRLMQEELERRKDPATLLSAVEQIMKAAQAASAVSTPTASAASEAKAPVKRASKRAAAAPPAE